MRLRREALVKRERRLPFDWKAVFFPVAAFISAAGGVDVIMTDLARGLVFLSCSVFQITCAVSLEALRRRP